MSDKFAICKGIGNISLTTNGIFLEKYARVFVWMKMDTVQLIPDKNTHLTLLFGNML